MSTFLLLLIILYVGFVSVHLYSCLFGIENPRMFTKIFLMPFLSLIYYKATPKREFFKNYIRCNYFRLFRRCLSFR